MLGRKGAADKYLEVCQGGKVWQRDQDIVCHYESLQVL